MSGAGSPSLLMKKIIETLQTFNVDEKKTPNIQKNNIKKSISHKLGR